MNNINNIKKHVMASEASRAARRSSSKASPATHSKLDLGLDEYHGRSPAAGSRGGGRGSIDIINMNNINNMSSMNNINNNIETHIMEPMNNINTTCYY